MADGLTLSERIWSAAKAWQTEHGRWPSAVRCSPLVSGRLIRASGGPSAIKWDAVEHRDDGSHQARFGRDVRGMDWFEDTRLQGESFTFE